jgi:putative ATP-dependent endonuclease of OLD family
MFIERLALTTFRCFGPVPTVIDLTSGLTTFVGVNGAGKTAVMQALQRLFGITGDHRRLRRQDFHVPAAELIAPLQRSFVLEVMLAFPELDAGAVDAGAVPEFFQQMATDEAGRLKCRLRLEATWTDDGSLEGTIEQRYRAVRTLGPFDEADCIELKALDRARIQMICVPASRDGASQVTAFLRGRLWRPINWSQGVRDTFSEAGSTLNDAFSGEAAVEGTMRRETRIDERKRFVASPRQRPLRIEPCPTSRCVEVELGHLRSRVSTRDRPCLETP